MENQNARQYLMSHGISSAAAGGGGGWRRTQGNKEEEEFQESDVWELNRMGGESLYLDRKVDTNYNNVNVPDLWDLTTTTTTTTAEQKRRPVGLLSRLLASGKTTLSTTVMSSPTGEEEEEEESGKLVHSAPVNVPDWSKIYGRRPSSRNKSAFYTEEGGVSEESEEDDNGEEDLASSVVPPHEWLARKEMIRSKTMSPSSVSEGIGRTLKGRDLKRVRNAVLTRTGFL